jgi:hypothetical protein
MTVHSAHVRAAGRRASNSTPFQLLARAGIAARGVTYLLIGYLAVRVAFGKGGQADRQGALQTVAKTTGGTVILWLLAIGFAGMALWRFSEALFGQAGPDGHKATKRLASLARGVFYTGWGRWAARPGRSCSPRPESFSAMPRSRSTRGRPRASTGRCASSPRPRPDRGCWSWSRSAWSCSASTPSARPAGAGCRTQRRRRVRRSAAGPARTRGHVAH